MTMPEIAPTLSDSQKIAVNQVTQATRLNEHETDIQILNRVVLLGNGELPLRETVRNHSAVIGEWKYWIKFFIGLLIAQAAAVLGGIIFTFIKVMPLLERIASQP